MTAAAQTWRQSGYSPDSFFRGATATTTTLYDPLEISTARTKWNDVNASFLGFKASACFRTGHLDAGGFVFDANGHRWFTEFGYGNTADTDIFIPTGRFIEAAPKATTRSS